MAKLAKKERQPVDAPQQSGSVLDALCFHLGRAFYQYVGLVEQQFAALGLDALRPGMIHIIFALFEEDDVIIKDLVERTQLSPSALTGLLQRMEAAGLIRRYRDKLDGRAVRISLTPGGRGLQDKCLAAHRTIRSIMERAISEGDIQCAKRVLVQMAQNIRTTALGNIAGGGR